ncbi:phage tail protein [Vibrio natriegens]|uniref:phage tail-collar fiber domain-containing protein n=1 Tax=Vibrio natriegens TaxID=691 RepID=UPI000A80228B|nr:phage tail protein [Vibrio natriegens]
MANTTDKSILTAAGKALLAQLNAEEKPLIIDKMMFANVPNRPEFPQPDDVVPTDDIVHQEQVEQRGRLSADSVIYSTTLTSDVGPFEFNWTGAYCSEYGVLVTIDHHALTPKTADEPGVAGNTLVRSVVLEYKDIAELTNITVDASSWQYNATGRMKKMDSDVAQSIIDQNGKDWFIKDGFLVTPSGSAYNIKAGAGYVSGNRVSMEFDRSVQVPNKPSFIYIDAHREGTPTGEQVTLFDFVITSEEKDDYIDSSTGKDIPHFVCKIAEVLADGSVSDLRPENVNNREDYYRQQENTASRILEGTAESLQGCKINGHTHIRLKAEDQNANQLLIMSPIPNQGLIVQEIDLESYTIKFLGGQTSKLRGVSFDVDTRADMYGLKASVGSTIRTLTAFGTEHGGWTYDVVNNVAPNGLNKIDIGNGLTAIARLGGIVPAGAYGAKLDLVTDDYPALKALHDDGVTYSLDGKTGLCNGTLSPRSHQTIYPYGGGIYKKTPGYLFQKLGSVDNFVIEVGGNWDGGGVADFCDQDGSIGWGNGWTNCLINGIGSNFVNIFRLSNARRSTIKGRWHGRKALIYSNKSAECDVQFANFVRAGDLSGSIGLQCIDEGAGYPEGLVVNAGMFYQFEKNLDIQDIFELNFASVEFAGGEGNYQDNGAQIDIRANGGQFVRGVYFDSNCHYHGRGMQFGSGQDNAPHSYECVVDGYFRSQKPGTTINLERFTHDVHIKDGTIFRYDGSPGTRIAVVGKQQQQGITVGSIKCYGYDSYVQFKGAGENNLVNNIPNLSNLASGAPCSFEYAVNYSNIQGMNNIIHSDNLVNDTYPANTNIKTVRVKLGEGEYLLRTRASVNVLVAGSFGLRIQPVSSGVSVVAGGAGWSSMYGTLDASEKSFEKTVVVSVLKGGEFDVILETRESLSITTTGYHDYISVEKV